MTLSNFIEIKEAIIEELLKPSPAYFFTGAAGTGKSTMLDHLRNQLDLKKMLVAPTGVGLEGRWQYYQFRF